MSRTNRRFEFADERASVDELPLRGITP